MAVVLTRLCQSSRTFVPFVAGRRRDAYPVFALYKRCGGVLWVGNLRRRGVRVRERPVIKNNFSLVALGLLSR